MYHEVGIQALSPKQISRILNGHGVRVKAGSHHKMHLSSEHAKKLHRAHLKGSAVTVTLDPYAIEHNQHLRSHVGRVAHKALTGKGPKGIKKFQKWTTAIGDYLKPVAKPILGALTDQAVNNINAYGDQSASMAGQGLHKYRGTGPKGIKKFQKWTSAIGDFVKPVAKPILGALTDQAVHNINAYGDQSASMAGMGVRRRAHRAKRVMSEAQKEALAKGRHALRLKLTEMGAGRAHHAHPHHRVHHGKALMPAGYGMEEYC